MTSQNDPQDESFTGQVRNDVGHCPLTAVILSPASRRAQFLDLFCLYFTLMIFLMSIVSLNLYCLLMTQVSFVPIEMPTTSFLLLTMNLQK